MSSNSVNNNLEEPENSGPVQLNQSGAKLDSPSDDAYLISCQQAIGYQFSNVRNLDIALRHASGVPDRLSSNERLEFLGDAILGFVVCERLFELYPEYHEGDLTKIKSVVVSRETCAKMSDVLGMQHYLVLGKGMAADPKIPRSVVAAVFESIVGAIHLDGGIEAARRFILKQVDPEIAQAVSGQSGDNFKSLLQQFAQREHGVTPSYSLLDEKGPDHSKCFNISAQVGPRQFPAAWGRSKKEAEQRAANNAMCELEGRPLPHATAAQDSEEQH